MVINRLCHTNARNGAALLPIWYPLGAEMVSHHYPLGTRLSECVIMLTDTVHPPCRFGPTSLPIWPNSYRFGVFQNAEMAQTDYPKVVHC